jgi:CDP-diacylglycerol--serine O-phosphatidyltransferase
MVLPVFLMVVLFFALLISYPWVVLTIGTVCYLASLPFGYLSYRRHERKDAASAGAAAGAEARASSEAAAVLPGHGQQAPDSNRRARLN